MRALYTSPPRRARSVAHAIASHLDLVPRSLGLLREVNRGRLEGMRLDQIQRRYPFHWRTNLRQVHDGFRWPGGESYREFRRRVLSAMNTIAAQHRGQRVIIVTHAGAISQIVGAPSAVRAACWEVFRPHNASLTVDAERDGSGQRQTGQPGEMAPERLATNGRARAIVAS